MISISYVSMLAFISIIWCIIRAICAVKANGIRFRRELQLLLVYICIIVVARFTFFPFSTVTRKLQPLVFDCANAFPFRTNWIPPVNILDHPEKRDLLLNVIGNTAMFIPLGIVWPGVYRKLDTHVKVIAAGIGFSLFIEIAQLPFYDRVTDIDDLMLNSLGLIIGYLIYLPAKALKGKSAHR